MNFQDQVVSYETGLFSGGGSRSARGGREWPGMGAQPAVLKVKGTGKFLSRAIARDNPLVSSGRLLRSASLACNDEG